jgi:tetratricopeptide (TPR) repeat protein
MAGAERIAAARAALKAGELELAASLAADVLRGEPGNLDALEIKALVEIEQGDEAGAERTLRAAIALAPDRRWPYGDLARLLLRQDRASDAESVARASLAADPDNADAHAMLASLLAQREMLVPAADHFQRAIAIVGPHPDLQLGLGRTLLRQGKIDAARPLLEAAAVSNPGALEPNIYLAELEERAGDFEAATRFLDRAEPIATAQGKDVKLQRSVLLERIGDDQAALQLLDAEAELSGEALLQRGRLRDRLGRHAQAWSDWTRGKAQIAERTGRNYPADDVEREAEALARFFTTETFAALPRARKRSGVPQPIFILGFPRSGTTLVEQILASHSAIRAGGELPFGRELRELTVDLGQVDPERLCGTYLAGAEAYGLSEPGVLYFTDKMPLNDMWLPLLRIAFPQSPVVLVRRHPLDVLTSVMAHDMTHGFNCAYRLEDAARHLALVDRLVAEYRNAGIAITHELKYETLVADQVGETERLMAAIGLPMEPAQLRFHERAAVSQTPSYVQVREPLNDRSIGRWRNHASALEAVRPIVADAMARGGYA